MKKQFLFVMLLTKALVVGSAGCSGSGGSSSTLPECQSEPPFSVLPVEQSAILYPSLLGNLNPPSHTIPNDHSGIYLNRSGVTIKSPGRLLINLVRKTTYVTSSFRQGQTDYAIYFDICRSIKGHFGHIASLDSAIEAGINWTACENYSTADETVQSCNETVSRTVEAGQVLGIVGSSTAQAFDFGLYDQRNENSFVNKNRVTALTLNAVCPWDYFATDLKATLLSLTQRTEEPRCGTMNVDVGGSAQGVWVQESNPVNQTGDESPFITLAPHYVRPSTQLILSLGSAELGATSVEVDSQTSGQVNRRFSEITGNNAIHCYVNSVTLSTLSYFVALGSDGKLKIEKKTHAAGSTPCSSGSSSWSFSAAAVTYIR